MLTRRWAFDGAVALAIVLVLAYCSSEGILAQTWAYDALAYYRVDQAHPYLIPMNQVASFLYSPAFAQAMLPFQGLPWLAFQVAWTALLVGAILWMAPGRAALVLFLPFVAMELVSGNVHLLIAGAVVAGFRWPAAWAFVLLTKVTPGVGLAWFAARRDWRSLTVALGVTAAIAAASFLVAPGAWAEWVGRLSTESGTVVPGLVPQLVGPLWLRVAVGAAVAAVGGLLGWRWPVAIAVTIALPNPTLNSPAVLVALLPLAVMDRRDPLPPVLSLARRRPHAASPSPCSTPAPTAPPG